jgi:hypothetical protein
MEPIFASSFLKLVRMGGYAKTPKHSLEKLCEKKTAPFINDTAS